MVRATLLHELGHSIAFEAFGTDGHDPRWKEWEKAGEDDRVSATEYGKESPHEDFAETLVVYEGVRGTKEEAAIRAIFPRRFAIIDRVLAAKRNGS